MRSSLFCLLVTAVFASSVLWISAPIVSAQTSCCKSDGCAGSSTLNGVCTSRADCEQSGYLCQVFTCNDACNPTTCPMTGPDYYADLCVFHTQVCIKGSACSTCPCGCSL